MEINKNNHFNFKSDIERFLPVGNRLAYYYDKVFNIQIITTLGKEDKLRENVYFQLNQLEKIKTKQNYFYILFVDNNKKIFRYKVLKCKVDVNEFIRENEGKDFKFDDFIYYFIDKNLCEYCKKQKYLDKKDILDKAQMVEKSYQQFLNSIHLEQK